MSISLWKAEQLGKENFALGAASRNPEIAELKVVSDHNLKVYQEAASKMRAEIATANMAYEVVQKDCWNLTQKVIPNLRELVDEKETQRQNLMAAYERQGNSAQEVISTLRKQVKVLQDTLARHRGFSEAETLREAENAVYERELAATEPKEIPE